MPRSQRIAALLVAALVLALAPGFGLAQPPTPWAPDELLVGFHADVADADAEAVYRGHGAAKLEKLRGLRVHRVRVPPSALEAIERALARRPEVKFVERNRLLAPDLAPNDPSYPSQWHLPKISAQQAWDISTGVPEVVIAILDTGVDGTHPDLAAKMVAGYNSYDKNTDTRDVYGHGTKVAGAAAAIGNNGVGVSGVSWQSRIMPVRVSDTSGYAYYSTISNGLTWAVDHGAKVMNISFGGVAASSSIASAAQYVRSRGGVVVAAAGNCGCLDSTAPNSQLISVSATDSNDNLASWSSRGTYVDVAAPGAGILTTAKGGGYSSVSGTSFASPVTAGVVALMMAANPTLAPADLEALLKANADDKGAAGWDSSFGFGRINAYRAIAAAAASSPLPPPPPPPDTTAPANVAGFSATASGTATRIDLTWTNPTSDFAGVLILRRAGSPVTEAPVAGQSYGVGQSIGSSLVIYSGTASAFSDSSVVSGTTYHYRAFSFDAVRNYSAGVSASATPLAAATSCAAEVIVDNLAPGQSSAQVSFIGTWTKSAGSGAYGANGSLYSNGSGLDTYTWKTPVLNSAGSCTYKVYVWWTSHTNRSAAVPITVTHAGGSSMLTFNQRSGGGQWTLHGSYTFAAGTRGVVQVSDAGGQAAADAVRFALDSGAAAPIILDNGAAGTSLTGKWCVSGATNFYGANSLYSCGSGTDTYRWTPTIAAVRSYDVYVWWTTHANRSASVPISVTHAGGTTTRTFDERTGGGQWVLHGRYSFTAGTAGYVQTTDASGQAAADAVRFVPAP